MGLQDELREAVAAGDVPRIQTLADGIARTQIERFQRKIDAIMFGGTATPQPPCKCRIVHVPGCPNFCP